MKPVHAPSLPSVSIIPAAVFPRDVLWQAGGAAVPLHHLVEQFACGLGLSRRETDVLALAAQGLSMKEAAAALAISTKTVEDYWSRIYVKAQRPSQLAVVSRFIDWLSQQIVAAGPCRGMPGKTGSG